MKWYLSFLVLLIAAGCHKKSTTPADAEYFNCKIDANTGAKQPSYSNHDALKASFSNSLLPHYSLGGDNVDDFPQTGIGFYLGDVSFPNADTFILTTYSEGNYVSLSNFDTSGNYAETNDTSTGKIIFTNRSANLLQGTFYFDAYCEFLHRVAHVTEGKFSIKPD